MIKKNDIYTVRIEDMGTSGEGIGKVNGYPLFVKDSVMGDLAEVKVTKAGKNFGYARLMNVVEPSSARVEPACPVARRCGGCQLQAMSYEEQLKFKENKVYNNLVRIGKLSDFTMHPIIGMDEPYCYRNKAQFPVGTDKDGRIIAGFYAGRTHSIIETEDCVLGDNVNKEIVNIVKNHMSKNGIKPYDEVSGKGIVRHILIRKGAATGQIMVCIVINGNKLTNSKELVKELNTIGGMTSITLNVNKEKSNVILGKEIINLYGDGYIVDYIKDIKFRISPLSFYQVNPIQTEKLYETALKYAGLTGNETVWDLYCGIGTISLFMAKKAGRVFGVEIVPQAIEDAKRNAQINGFTNVEFVCGKAEDIVCEEFNIGASDEVDIKFEDAVNIADSKVTEIYAPRPNVVVVDPPRKGCDKALIDTIIKNKPERVVYVSCDSATLARDLKLLSENGYVVQEVQPVDMFPQTVHVESVVLLTKVRN